MTAQTDAFHERLQNVIAQVRAWLDAPEWETEREALARALGETDRDVLAAMAVVSALCVRLLEEEAPFAPELLAASGALIEDETLSAARAHCVAQIELLGPTYERLVARASRYQSGQYFTPAPLARHMAALLELDGDAPVVLDPASGAGVLLAAAAERHPEATLIAHDIHPVCCLMTRAGLAARGLAVEVVQADFLDVSACNAPRAEVDAILCNPPYVRHHLLEKTRKKGLADRYSALHGVALSTLSTSYVYFFLEALARLRPAGRMVCLTPADYLDARYGEAVKEALSARHTLARVELFDRDTLAFAGARTTTAITVVEKTPPVPGATTSLVEAKLSARGVVSTSCREVDLATLARDASWSLQFGTQRAAHQQLCQGRTRRLGDYMRTRRGIATGANGFFVLTQATVEAWQIEPEHLVPALAAARDLPDDTLTYKHWEASRDAGRPVWLLDCRLTEAQLEGTRVLAYLEHGRALGVHERYNCKRRNPWYRVEQVAAPDVIITYMNRGKTRFVRNEAGCRVMSVFLNGFLLDDTLDLEALLAVLNSPETSALVRQLGRTYGGGLCKIEPRDLLDLPMPALS